VDIQYVSWQNLKPAEWRVTHVLRPDFRKLKDSIESFGLLSPLVAKSDTGEIIDGFHRWMIAQNDDSLGANLPVVFVECDRIDAMVLSIRLNRERGFVVAKRLSRAVKQILRSGKFTDEELRLLLGMTMDEFDVVADGSLVKSKKIKDYKFGQAWVPVEADKAQHISIERPPTEDK
jgi:ParB-like chromosome segregation protein Spo0J